MDKETLSNYGWIVICILVLSVMIALATPFGTYVSNAVKSTTQGLFDVQQKAMGVAGLVVDDQSFEDMLNGKPVYYGDLDKDGDIDEDDINIITYHCLSDSHEKQELITDIDTLRRGDLNGDCIVDSADAMAIAKYINIGIYTFPVEDMPYYYGDIDMDGDIDEDDANMAHNYVLGFEGYELTADQIKRVDVNADGKTDGQDTIIINAYVQDKLAFFPAGR